MEILLIFRFFHYTWFIDRENLFHSYFKRKNGEVLTFDIVHFPNLEIIASFLLAPYLKISKFNERQGHLLEHLLNKISRGKDNQAIKFVQLIEYNIRNIFFEKSHKTCSGETIPNLKNQN